MKLVYAASRACAIRSFAFAALAAAFVLSTASAQELAFQWQETPDGLLLESVDESAIPEDAQVDCIVPESVDGKRVVGIKSQAFAGLTRVKSVALPEGIERLEGWTFSNCAVESVSLPNALKSIDGFAFVNCGRLAEIEIPAATLEIGTVAFHACPGLQRITVAPDNPYYRDIDGVLFNKEGTVLIRYPRNRADARWEIPEGVKRIPKYSFSGAPNLVEIAFPESLVSFETTDLSRYPLEKIVVAPSNPKFFDRDGVLFDKSGALLRYPRGKKEARYEIPNDVESIASLAFARVETEDLAIPTSVKKIDDNAFFGAEVRRLEIPDSVETIGDQAFYRCPNLVDVKIGANVKRIGVAALMDCPDLERVALPDGLETIERQAFAKTPALKSIELPEKLSNIDATAFDHSAAVLRATRDSYPHRWAENAGRAFDVLESSNRQ